MRKYGLSAAEFEVLAAAQNGACAICAKVYESAKLHVDHDHDSGKVRALLCGSCNRAIGMLKDDPALCRAAADYLTKHR